MHFTGAAVWCDFVRVKIFDDDVDFKTLLPENINNTLDDDIGDDNPAVAEFVDERPQHVKELERFRLSKQWKLVSQKPGSQLFSLNLMLFQLLCLHQSSVSVQ